MENYPNPLLVARLAALRNAYTRPEFDVSMPPPPLQPMANLVSMPTIRGGAVGQPFPPNHQFCDQPPPFFGVCPPQSAQPPPQSIAGAASSSNNNSRTVQLPHAASFPSAISKPRNASGKGKAAKSIKTPTSAKSTPQATSSSNKAVYKEYWAQELVDEGLKSGILFEGPLRINLKNYEEAYVEDVKSADGEDYFICGLVDRNRSFPTDIVVIKPLERAKCVINESVYEQYERPQNTGNPNSTATKPIENNEKNEKKPNGNNNRRQYRRVNEVEQRGQQKIPDSCILKSAEVVSIKQRVHSRIGVGTLRTFSRDFILFSPSDSRIPRALLPASEAPQGFFDRPQDFTQFIYVAQFNDDWPTHSRMPKGKLLKKLGNAGEIEPEMEGCLMQYDVDVRDYPDEFTADLPTCDEDGKFEIPPDELSARRDFRSELLFTIDPKTARDLDDALHIKQIDKDTIEIGVHIADVSYFVKPDTELDSWASRRATSTYLVHKVISMLPRRLCEQLCSLNAGVDRLAMSVVWHMNRQGEIEQEWFGRSVIRSVCKLTYDHAQDFIEQEHRDLDWEEHELPPITGSYQARHLAQAVRELHDIAKHLRQRRYDNGALRLDQPKLSFSLDKETGMPIGCSVYERKSSNFLIEEFMLLANMATARRIYHKFPEIAVLRRHPSPNAKLLRQALELCESLGFALDGSSSAALQASLQRLAMDPERRQSLFHVLTQILMKPMKLAVCFCTGVVEDETLFRHYALSVPFYTHFTSPIRRYPDIMVHRLLAASLGYCDPPSLEPLQVHKVALHCNDRKVAAKAVSDFSAELFFNVFVKECGPITEKCIVMIVQDHSFDVLLIRYGIQKRVYTNNLNLSQDATYDEGPPSTLNLKWESGREQIIQICTILDVTLTVMPEAANPLKVVATIADAENAE